MLHLDVLSSDSLEEVTEGREVAALTLGEVVGDLVATLLDGLEHVVGHVLHGGGDGGEQSLLLVGNVLHGALLHSLGLSLTELDGTNNVLVEVSDHTLAELADGITVLGGIGLPGHGDTGGALETSLEGLGIAH